MAPSIPCLAIPGAPGRPWPPLFPVQLYLELLEDPGPLYSLSSYTWSSWKTLAPSIPCLAIPGAPGRPWPPPRPDSRSWRRLGTWGSRSLHPQYPVSSCKYKFLMIQFCKRRIFKKEPCMKNTVIFGRSRIAKTMIKEG